jgi:hypothetical protein
VRRRQAALALTAVLLCLAPCDARAGAPADEARIAQRGRAPGRGGGRGAGESIADARVLVEGRLLAVDHATGRVELRVNDAPVEAVFPAARVKEMQPGDRVFVTFNLIDPRVATVQGSVAAVDPVAGTITLATPRGPLTLEHPPAALAAMRPGDPILLKLELVDIGPPER